jgi:cytochrome b involved in lipid metabolism
LSFDAGKLPQATMHKYVGDPGSGLTGEAYPARAKVPVRDGRSQNKFLLEAQRIRAITENAMSTFYTTEEVA